MVAVERGKTIEIDYVHQQTIAKIMESLFPLPATGVTAIEGPFPLYTRPLQSSSIRVTEYTATHTEPIVFATDNRTVVLKSECGTGKSTVGSQAVVNALQQLQSDQLPGEGVLVLSHRRSLSHALTTKLKETKTVNGQPLEIACYLDHKQSGDCDLTRKNNLVISIDSVGRLLKTSSDNEMDYSAGRVFFG